MKHKYFYSNYQNTHTQSTSKQVNSCSSASDFILERSCSNLDWNTQHAD